MHFVGVHDRTYIGYVTSTGDVEVISQDAGTATLTHTTLHPLLQADDHAAPGLVVLPDHKIAVFYSPHGGLRMMYRISLNAEDISSFGPESSITTNTGTGGFSYANPIYLSAEHRLYLFFRGANLLPAMTSSTDFVHWTAAVQTVIPKQQATNQRPYVKYATNGTDTIAIAFTDGHPREVPSNSVYEMTLKHGVLFAPNGTPISVLDPDNPLATDTDLAARYTGAMNTDWLRTGNGGLVYDDSGHKQGWLESVALGANDVPSIVYSTYQDLADAEYHYARWNGAGWTASDIVDAGGTIAIEPGEPQYSGGADLDQNDPSTVYLSRDVVPGTGQWEIERWHTADGGASFEQPTAVTVHSVLKNVRPVVPWGTPGSEITVLWMSGSYAYWDANGYATQLRELTLGRAPTTARISTTATTIDAGAPVQIGGRIVQGYQGEFLPGAVVTLLGHTAGNPDQVLGTLRAGITGLVSFPVRPTATMQLTVRFQPTQANGASTSPSIVVNVRQPALVRISRSATAVRRGHPVVIGMRAVDARNGAYLPRAVIELWQTYPGHPWARIGRYIATSAGLVQVTRTPGVTVTYQARLATGTANQAAVSPTLAVKVT